MINKWKKMSRSERTRAQVFMVALLLAGYAPLFMFGKKQLDSDVKMLNRRLNRIETRTSMKEFGGDGPSIQSLKNRIKKVQKQIDEADELFGEVDSGYAAMDSAEQQQLLRVELSNLAEYSGVQLLSVARKNTGDGIYIDPITNRPVLLLKAQAPFERLNGFLKGLEKLSYHVCVMNVTVSTTDPDESSRRRGNASKSNAGAGLFLQLQLSI